jgi:hypothetical protein
MKTSSTKARTSCAGSTRTEEIAGVPPSFILPMTEHSFAPRPFSGECSAFDGARRGRANGPNRTRRMSATTTIVCKCYDSCMSSKQRLSASVDIGVLTAAREAVSDGRATNISAWVNEALHRQAEHDRRMRALDQFLSAYESEHGSITDEEIEDASRRSRGRALIVRGKRPPAPARSKSAGSATTVQRRRRRGAT